MTGPNVPLISRAGAARPRWTVVVCAYTWERFEQTQECVTAVLAQPERPQVVLVVDHNADLAAALAARFPTVNVVPNIQRQGLGGARNSGVVHASGDLVAFVDDDATATRTWLGELEHAFEDPTVVGVGGQVEPVWGGEAPGWYPPEFLWVVGCSYSGLSRDGDVRNPLGCNMAFRRLDLEAIGGFHQALGRLGSLPFGLEETELCVRLRRARPQARIVMVPGAVVHHHVPRNRHAFRYFVERCYYEGVGKSLLSDLATSAALSSERSYALGVLPKAVVREVVRSVALDRPIARLGRVAAIAAGLAAASAGYLRGRLRLLARAGARPEAVGEVND